MEYELVCSPTSYEFNAAVNNKIQEGFEPLGSHTISPVKTDDVYYGKMICISMIKK